MTTNEIERLSFSATELRNATSWADITALVESQVGEILDASTSIGDGFALLKEKDQLIGKPMLLVNWLFAKGDFGEQSEFATIRLATQSVAGDLLKYIIVDGSTGLCRQLHEFTTETGRSGGIVVGKGLTRSDYTYTNDNGEEIPASTYYLDLSAPAR
jgi:hypothetical protein